VGHALLGITVAAAFSSAAKLRMNGYQFAYGLYRVSAFEGNWGLSLNRMPYVLLRSSYYLGQACFVQYFGAR